MLNLYGDDRLATKTGHGVDISSQRADDLDLMALDEIISQVRSGLRPRVLDVGCGHGGQAIRMASAGADVVAIDHSNYRDKLRALAIQSGAMKGSWIFKQADVRVASSFERFDAAVCQRMLHYLRYSEAGLLLRSLRSSASNGALLYLSASGMDSELGNGYAGRDIHVFDRFSELSPEMARKHSIFPPVCLYRPDELSLLTNESGWSVRKVFTSAFGNIKLVAQADA